MAKWGQGDPRWIVEERADATNVNNWHWIEKNATVWSKEKIKQLLVGLTVEDNDYKVVIKDMTKCEGEASANNRKAKLIFFYEWVINGEWEGYIKTTTPATEDDQTKSKAYKGTFEVTNFSEENKPEEVEVIVDIKDQKQHKLKEFMRSKGVKEMHNAFAKYIQLLKDEFSQGLILPTAKENGNSQNKQQNTSPGNKTTTNEGGICPKTSLASQVQLINEGIKIPCKKLMLEENFKCRAEELYNVFTDINMVRAFCRSSNIVYEPQKDGKFSLFDSNVIGKFVELIPNKKITMNWRNKRWPDEHYSTCTLEFIEKEDCTLLKLVQTLIPQNYIENTEEGWKNYYFNSIKETFGFGSRIF